MGNNEYIETVWQDAVTLSMAATDSYAQFLSVLLESIKTNANSHRKYDIVILQYDMSRDNKKILVSIFNDTPNVSLRFFDLSRIYNDIHSRIKCGRDTSEQYSGIEDMFRIYAPIIFQKYERVVITDIDLVFDADPAELYTQDMQGRIILAALESLPSRLANGVGSREEGMPYFNTGVMLMDIKACLSYHLCEKCVDAISGGDVYLHRVQCALNKVCGNKIGILASEWNWEIKSHEDVACDGSTSSQCTNIKNPKIIHFVEQTKPWTMYDVEPRHQFWWKYACFSPYYEQIITKYIQNFVSSLRKSPQLQSLPILENLIQRRFNIIANIID